VVTDSIGQFDLHDYARLLALRIIDPRYHTIVDTVQVWPDSSLVVRYFLSMISPVTYPLHVGDLWNWGSTVGRVIGDTIMPNGRRYAVRDDPTYVQYRFQRYEGNRVYIPDWYGNEDRLVYDFTRLPGETIATYINGDDTTDFILSWSGQSLILGRTRSQWGIWRDTRNVWDDEVYLVFTDSIGVTHAEGMWFYDDLDGAIINGEVFGVVDGATDLHQLVPGRCSLAQNHPNPFNPTTTISYDLPRSSKVSLAVYDMLGREVAMLVNEVKGPGTYTVQWAAAGVSSGVYLYRLTAGSFVETRKLVLVR
jgi:hypothetical protein